MGVFGNTTNSLFDESSEFAVRRIRSPCVRREIGFPPLLSRRRIIRFVILKLLPINVNALFIYFNANYLWQCNS